MSRNSIPNFWGSRRNSKRLLLPSFPACVLISHYQKMDPALKISTLVKSTRELETCGFSGMVMDTMNRIVWGTFKDAPSIIKQISLNIYYALSMFNSPLLHQCIKSCEKDKQNILSVSMLPSCLQAVSTYQRQTPKKLMANLPKPCTKEQNYLLFIIGTNEYFQLFKKRC